MRRSFLSALTLLALFRFAPLVAEEPAPRLSLDMPAVRWQLLPDAVKSVVVGPDGRTWYQLDSDAQGRSDANIRSALEAECRQTSPQIKGASIALLEPGGGAWFYVDKGRTVWGYDGRRWIERKAQAGSRFVGLCPTRGQLPDNLTNRVAGGITWLRDEQGIHIYDGESWTYAALCPSLNTVSEFPRLAVSRSGKFAVAMTPKTPHRTPFLLEPDLWVCEDGSGKWHKRDIQWPNKTNPVGTMCVTDDGIVYCIHGSGSLRAYSLIGARDGRELAARLIPDLDHDDFTVRQRAHDKLRELAEHIRPELESALKVSNSAERTRWLEALFLEASADKSVLDIRPGAVGTVVGPCHVRNAKSIFQNESGKLYIFAEYIVRGTDPPVNGLAIIHRSGELELHQLVEQQPHVIAAGGMSLAPIFSSASDAVWLSGNYRAGPARRLDLSLNKVTAQTPDMRFAVVHAVDDRGHAFLTRGKREPLSLASSRIGLLSPEILDSRPVLTVDVQTIGRPDFVVASDGAVWAWRRGQGLARYDGSAWQVIQPQPRLNFARPQDFGTCYPALAGRDKVVLCHLNNEIALFQNSRLIAVAPLRKLVATYQPTFVAAFPPDFTPPQQPFRIAIATDSQGNIWTSDRGRAAVYADGNWIEINSSLPTAATAGGGVRFLSAVGTGRQVYIATPGSRVGQGAFMARIEDGKVEIADAPQGSGDIRVPMGIRDHSGALWLPGRVAAADRGDRPELPYRSVRLGDQGVLDEVVGSGWPILVDRSDNTWLVQVHTGSLGSALAVWRDGQIVQQHQIAGVQSIYGLISDQPGSVYAWTTLGLHHFTASLDDPGQFRLSKTYRLPPIPVFGDSYSYSSLAGLMIPAPTGGSHHQLSMIRLPRE